MRNESLWQSYLHSIEVLVEYFERGLVRLSVMDLDTSKIPRGRLQLTEEIEC